MYDAWRPLRPRVTTNLFLLIVFSYSSCSLEMVVVTQVKSELFCIRVHTSTCCRYEMLHIRTYVFIRATEKENNKRNNSKIVEIGTNYETNNMNGNRQYRNDNNNNNSKCSRQEKCDEWCQRRIHCFNCKREITTFVEYRHEGVYANNFAKEKTLTCGLRICLMTDRWSITIILFIRYFWHFTRTALRLCRWPVASATMIINFAINYCRFCSSFSPIDDLYRLITLPGNRKWFSVSINCNLPPNNGSIDRLNGECEAVTING